MSDDKANNPKEPEKIFEAELLPQIEGLFSLALILSKSVEKANELVQETYLQAYRKIDEYTAGSDAKAWLEQLLREINKG